VSPFEIRRYRSTHKMDVSSASPLVHMGSPVHGSHRIGACPPRYTITCRTCGRSVEPLVTDDQLIIGRWKPDWSIEASFMAAPCEHWEVMQ